MVAAGLAVAMPSPVGARPETLRASLIGPARIATSAASTYHPVRPFTAYASKGRVAPGRNVVVALARRGRMPAAGGLDAVAVTVTVSRPTTATTATLRGVSGPPVRVVSAAAGRDSIGYTDVPVSSSGVIRARLSGGHAALRIVVTGYDSAGRTGESFHALAPATVLAAHKLGPGGSRTVAIVGAPRTGLPSNGQVAAVALSVTVSRPSATTTITAYPRGATGGSAIVGAHRAVTTSGSGIVEVGTHGDIVVHNARGHATISARVEGYWTTDSTGGSLRSLPATTVYAGTVAATAWRKVRVAGRGALPPAGQISAVMVSITAGPPSRAASLDVEPARGSAGASSPVSVAAHTRVTTTVLARLAGPAVFVSVSRRMPITVSVVGWYGDAAAAADLNASAAECTGEFPTGIAFAVIRATNGQPYGSADANCFQTETLEAQQLPVAPQFYLNLADPGTASSHWNAGGPKPCATTANYDASCAYDYGYEAAAQAIGFARANGAPPGSRWWIDVETDNTWGNVAGGVPGHLAANIADIQGALRYLTAHGYPGGVYTETSWWQAITGSPKGFSQVPVWGGGAGSAADARANCRQISITGGPALLAQWFTDSTHDNDVAC
jgi:hypothetical protein